MKGLTKKRVAIAAAVIVVGDATAVPGGVGGDLRDQWAFGFYPAHRASRLLPVDCLRYV